MSREILSTYNQTFPRDHHLKGESNNQYSTFPRHHPNGESNNQRMQVEELKKKLKDLKEKFAIRMKEESLNQTLKISTFNENEFNDANIQKFNGMVFFSEEKRFSQTVWQKESKETVGRHIFETYRNADNNADKVKLLVGSLSKDATNAEYILELFQYLAFYHWNSVDSFLFVLPKNQIQYEEEFLEALFSIPTLFLHFGFPLKEFCVGIPNKPELHKMLNDKKEEVMKKFAALLREEFHNTAHRLLLHNIPIEKKLDTITPDELDEAKKHKCVVDLQRLWNGHPLGINSLTIIKMLRKTEMVIVYIDDSLKWNVEQELFCLMALIQQKSHDAKFMLVTPSVKKYPKVDNLPDTFLSVLPENRSTEEHSSASESLSHGEYFPPAGPENSRFITQGDTEWIISEPEQCDITILHDYQSRSDHNIAARMRERLTHLRVYAVPYNISITKQTLNAIKNSQIVIALISRSFLSNRNRQNEFELALMFHSLRFPSLKLLPMIINEQAILPFSNLSNVFKLERSFCCSNPNAETDNLGQNTIDFLSDNGFRKNGNDIVLDRRFRFLVQIECGRVLTEEENILVNEWIENYNPQNREQQHIPIDLPINYPQERNNTNGLKIHYIEM